MGYLYPSKKIIDNRNWVIKKLSGKLNIVLLEFSCEIGSYYENFGKHIQKKKI